MKKEKFVILMLLSFVLVLSSLIAAQSNIEQIFRGSGGGLGWLIGGIRDTLAQIFGPIFGHTTMDEFLFAKVLLFFLIFSIVFMVLKRVTIFRDNKAVHIVVTTIVAILSVRYLQPNQIITAVLLPYGGLAGAITVMLPLFIFFYFIHSSMDTGFGRRAAWAIYGIILLIIWGSRPYEDMQISGNMIYLLSFGFVLLSFLFDRSIHRYFELASLEGWRERVNDAHIARLQSEYEQIRNVNSPTADRRRRALSREIRRSDPSWHS